MPSVPVEDPQPPANRDAALPRDSGVPENSKYTIGTLRYTNAGLVALFVWMLWGDFCFNMMEKVVPLVLPLQLRTLGASNTTVGVLTGSLPAVMNMIITPIVSFRSDRHRGPRGRRIPYLLWPSPFIAISLILLGFSDSIGAALHRLVQSTGISNTTVILITMSVFMVLFQFFNMFVASVYYYLFNDVVPHAFLGRFVALFGIVGSGAVFVFNLYVFPYAQTHTREIYIGMATLYLVAFWLMCRNVKEGEYPPPPEAGEDSGWLASLRIYFRDCFSHTLYLAVFGRMAFWSMAMTSATFLTYFGQQLGLDLKQIGSVNAWSTALLLVSLYPAGALVDRLHPVRVHLGSLMILPFCSLACFFFAKGYWSLLAWSLIGTPPLALMSASVFPLNTALFPAAKFGQFCSAQALLNAVTSMVGSALVGLFLDAMKDYRYLFLWMAIFQAVSCGCMVIAYRAWRKQGDSASLPQQISPAKTTA